MSKQQIARDDQARRNQSDTGSSTLGGWLMSETLNVFDAIHRIQFSAPWTDTPRPH